jgi:hypothetical protein
MPYLHLPFVYMQKRLCSEKGHQDSLPPPPPGERQIEVGQELRQGEIGASAHPISP